MEAQTQPGCPLLSTERPAMGTTTTTVTPLLCWKWRYGHLLHFYTHSWSSDRGQEPSPCEVDGAHRKGRYSQTRMRGTAQSTAPEAGGRVTAEPSVTLERQPLPPTLVGATHCSVQHFVLLHLWPRGTGHCRPCELPQHADKHLEVRPLRPEGPKPHLSPLQDTAAHGAQQDALGREQHPTLSSFTQPCGDTAAQPSRSWPLAEPNAAVSVQLLSDLLRAASAPAPDNTAMR